MDGQKLCKLCSKLKSHEEFHKDVTRKDGFHDRCRECRGCEPRDFLPTCGLKRCSVCKEIKSEEDDFSFRSLESGLRVTICRSCVNIRSRVWYQNNKTRHNEKTKAPSKRYRIKKREINKQLSNKLKDVPCKDCGIKYSPWVMQFDHLDSSKKKFNIASMVYGCKTEEAILEEVKKCEVVCANCHADRTYKRRNLKYGRN